jgi:hypothetical protein
MQVEVLKTDDFFQIKIPIRESYSDKNIRKFLDYLRIKKNAAKSQTTDEAIEKLSNEITQNWWDKNKDKFVK